VHISLIQWPNFKENKPYDSLGWKCLHPNLKTSKDLFPHYLHHKVVVVVMVAAAVMTMIIPNIITHKSSAN
jgi:hypothetical protein